MTSQLYHLAQINIGRALAPVDDPIMLGFMSRLAEVNAIADTSPGFVWRLQTEEGDATSLRPYEDDDRILMNMSVWESIEQLKEYVYKSVHSQIMSQRRQWFEKMEVYMALWWVKAGHIPSIAEAKQRLEHLQRHGPTPYAFTFKEAFQASDCREEDFLPREQ
jgi:hypothetical protein